ncbi:unnamed protein product [Pleuronectes platessa]|uniref:Uncharacterized protein n=1 Tax=Pleuronectes platessa TaxID=8262 RepID=A0A9N7U9S1_PLEPL|nr:unnamed protein product [Pleuronectes platessa]
MQFGCFKIGRCTAGSGCRRGGREGWGVGGQITSEFLFAHTHSRAGVCGGRASCGVLLARCMLGRALSSLAAIKVGRWLSDQGEKSAFARELTMLHLSNGYVPTPPPLRCTHAIVEGC